MLQPSSGLATGMATTQRSALRKKRVTAIAAECKVRGDYVTYGPCVEGNADFKDLALSAVDALREDDQ